MKTLKIRILFVVMMLCVTNLTAKVQVIGPEYLGIWKKLSPAPSQVDKKLGYLKFTIEVPPEGIPNDFKVYGPSVVFTGNCWGRTFDLWLEYRELLVESVVTNYVVTYEFPTNKFHSDLPSGMKRCFYHLEINLRDLPEILNSL